jgi:hypothetical protein
LFVSQHPAHSLDSAPDSSYTSRESHDPGKVAYSKYVSERTLKLEVGLRQPSEFHTNDRKHHLRCKDRTTIRQKDERSIESTPLLSYSLAFQSTPSVLQSLASLNKMSTEEEKGPVGCYLVFEPSSGGRLMLVYSKGSVPTNAVGFWLPGEGQIIQGFKFSSAGGRSELIKGIAGGDANRKKYFVGWCQFLKQAKAKKGKAILFAPEQGVSVDIYGYENSKEQPQFLDLESGLVDIDPWDAIAVIPRHAAFLKGVKSINQSNFLELGNMAGFATTM